MEKLKTFYNPKFGQVKASILPEAQKKWCEKKGVKFLGELPEKLEVNEVKPENKLKNKNKKDKRI
jgi:hypothetical protein